MILISLGLEPTRHVRVILSGAKDLTERSGTGRGAGVRSFAVLRTAGKKVVPD